MKAYGQPQVTKVTDSSIAAGLLQRKCAFGGSGNLAGGRDGCKENERGLQRKPDGHNHTDRLILPIAHEALRSPGQPLNAGTRTFMEPRFGHNFSKVRVNPSQPGTLQASLMVGQPGDRFEQEADSIADRVMRSAVLRGTQLEPSATSSAFDSIRRTPDETEETTPAVEAHQEEETPGAEQGQGETASSAEQVAAILLEEDNLEAIVGAQGSAEDSATPEASPTTAGRGEGMQAREIPGQTPTISAKQETEINALRGGGQPLSASSRAFFEPRFGHEFKHIRVHTGAEASRLAQAVRAKAFTVGRDIMFGEGHYQPTSPTGQWLMAHELTHVLQQQQGLSRSPTPGIRVQQTARPRVQGGFFKNLWSGIKKGASAVWGGVKAVAGKIWQGTKWGADKVRKGVKAVGRWSWNVLKSGAALAWSGIVNTPGRIWRLIKHLGSGVVGVAKWLWEGLKLAWHKDFKGMGKWLLDGILSGAAWVGRLFTKLIDIAGIGEIWDLVFQIIKFNTRALTSGEKSEAQKTFKNSISYWQVRVDQASLIAFIAAGLKRSGMAVTTFHTINFNQKIQATPGSGDMHWLTHELTHVSQYEHAGSQYMGEALHAQFSKGPGYNYFPNELWRPSSSVSPNTLGKHFSQFNREQQGDIAADYYFSLFNKPVKHFDGFTFTPVTAEYEPVIEELRKGNM
jgi:hypothetical protein